MEDLRYYNKINEKMSLKKGNKCSFLFLIFIIYTLKKKLDYNKFVLKYEFFNQIIYNNTLLQI